MADEEQDQVQRADAEQQSQFHLQRMYLKDLSYESPGTPKSFREKWEPEVNLEVDSQANAIEKNVYEVVLKVTVTVKNQGKDAFIVEVHQAGLFLIAGIEGMQLEHILKGVCPNILFPYVRETVSDAVTRGTFPQFLLQPINFEAASMETLQAQLKQEAGKEQGEEDLH